MRRSTFEQLAAANVRLHREIADARTVSYLIDSGAVPRPRGIGTSITQMTVDGLIVTEVLPTLDEVLAANPHLGLVVE